MARMRRGVKYNAFQVGNGDDKKDEKAAAVVEDGKTYMQATGSPP